MKLITSARGRSTRPASDAVTGEADLYLYDEIGDYGTSATTFIAQLNAANARTVDLHINSPGGDVFQGMAIANAIRQSNTRVVAHIDALAASIASVIALACDYVRMSDNAFLMIHNSWTIDIGNATQLRKTADTLDKLDGSIAGEYVKRTGKPLAAVQQWMADETWFTAADAESAGFIDAIDGETEATASNFDLSVFAHVPEPLLANRGQRSLGPKDLERALREAGCSRAAAKAILAGGLDAMDRPREAEPDRAAFLEAGRSLLSALSS